MNYIISNIILAAESYLVIQINIWRADLQVLILSILMSAASLDRLLLPNIFNLKNSLGNHIVVLIVVSDIDATKHFNSPSIFILSKVSHAHWTFFFNYEPIIDTIIMEVMIAWLQQLYHLIISNRIKTDYAVIHFYL